MFKNKNIFKIGIIALLLFGCKNQTATQETIVTEPDLNVTFEYPKDQREIRTPDGANSLDLETPLRCNVNWKTQQMVLSLPFNNNAFKLKKSVASDTLPSFEVTGFTFETMPADKALFKLTKEAGITLTAKDAPYASISGEDLKGEFSDVIDMITDAAGIFYTYDAKTNVMTLSRRAEFVIEVPHTRPILLALLDVLRGYGITDLTTNWAEYTITFRSDMEVKNKIASLIEYFEQNPTLVAYDVSVFKIFPHDGCDIEWQGLLDAFHFGTITTAQTGVIGRVLTTTNDLKIENLQRFLGNKATIVPVSEGKFIVPNEWLSRFDIGKCGKIKCAEADMSILAKAFVDNTNHITSNITLETTNGQVTQFKVRNKLGENFVIIGLPNTLFEPNEEKSETIIFMVPRLIKTMKTAEEIKNNI